MKKGEITMNTQTVSLIIYTTLKLTQLHKSIMHTIWILQWHSLEVEKWRLLCQSFGSQERSVIENCIDLYWNKETVWKSNFLMFIILQARLEWNKQHNTKSTSCFSYISLWFSEFHKYWIFVLNVSIIKYVHAICSYFACCDRFTGIIRVMIMTHIWPITFLINQSITINQSVSNFIKALQY